MNSFSENTLVVMPGQEEIGQDNKNSNGFNDVFYWVNSYRFKISKNIKANTEFNVDYRIQSIKANSLRNKTVKKVVINLQRDYQV